MLEQEAQQYGRITDGCDVIVPKQTAFSPGLCLHEKKLTLCLSHYFRFGNIQLNLVLYVMTITLELLLSFCVVL